MEEAAIKMVKSLFTFTSGVYGPAEYHLALPAALVLLPLGQLPQSPQGLPTKLQEVVKVRWCSRFIHCFQSTRDVQIRGPVCLCVAQVTGSDDVTKTMSSVLNEYDMIS